MFNRSYRLEIHSLIGRYFQHSLWTVAHMNEGTILVYCCPSIFSLTSSPPSQTKCTVYTDSVRLRGGGSGGELCCRPYSAGILHSVSDQMQNLPNYFTTPNKMTRENDIKGSVSLKFLRPWIWKCFVALMRKKSDVKCLWYDMIFFCIWREMDKGIETRDRKELYEFVSTESEGSFTEANFSS